MAGLMEAHLTTLIQRDRQCPHIILKHHQGQLMERLGLEVHHILHIFQNQQIIIVQQVQAVTLPILPHLHRSNSCPNKVRQ